MRKQPYGVDAAGAAYYLIDWAAVDCVRLYREPPPSLAAQRSAAAGAGAPDGSEPAMPPLLLLPIVEDTLAAVGLADYRVPLLPAPGGWEVACESGEALEELGRKLGRSKLPADMALSAKVSMRIDPSCASTSATCPATWRTTNPRHGAQRKT